MKLEQNSQMTEWAPSLTSFFDGLEPELSSAHLSKQAELSLSSSLEELTEVEFVLDT